MLHPYVQHWFEEHPNHNECFECVTDATFHATKAAAEAWCAKFANKKVVQHLRPIDNVEEAAQKAAEEAAQKVAEEAAQKAAEEAAQKAAEEETLKTDEADKQKKKN